MLQRQKSTLKIALQIHMREGRRRQEEEKGCSYTAPKTSYLSWYWLLSLPHKLLYVLSDRTSCQRNMLDAASYHISNQTGRRKLRGRCEGRKVVMITNWCSTCACMMWVNDPEFNNALHDHGTVYVWYNVMLHGRYGLPLGYWNHMSDPVSRVYDSASQRTVCHLCQFIR